MVITVLSIPSSLWDTCPLLEECCGVYRATCHAPGCSAFYIGQTGRTLKERSTEHSLTFRLNHPEQSVIAKHCLEENHHFNQFTFKLIHRATKGRLLNRLEKIEIVAASASSSNHLLNDTKFAFVNSFVYHFYNN